ncbi:MAG: AbrB/MazE/SpoVT family DNA-binding domain-containing protein [Lactobacillales bacterium]|jgi:AbrB family looped-hinge helix DNA binding protein|nr:AbrB/MazE/SpoVT family DNA-binding domain-containing protein [Lactobacillales bacterium]
MINTKISNNGQITIPVEIQKQLWVKDGDDVYFRVGEGTVIVENAVMAALKTAQRLSLAKPNCLALKPSMTLWLWSRKYAEKFMKKKCT